MEKDAEEKKGIRRWTQAGSRLKSSIGGVQG